MWNLQQTRIWMRIFNKVMYNLLIYIVYAYIRVLMLYFCACGIYKILSGRHLRLMERIFARVMKHMCEICEQQIMQRITTALQRNDDRKITKVLTNQYSLVEYHQFRMKIIVKLVTASAREDILAENLIIVNINKFFRIVK